VNLDGTLNILDIQTMIFHVIAPGTYVFNCEQSDIADFDQNGMINIVDLVNFIDLILGGGIAREHRVMDSVNLTCTSNSITLKEDGFVALDITLEHSIDTNIEFVLSSESIAAGCESISATSSRCIISTEHAGEVLTSDSEFEVVEITAAIPRGYVEVNLKGIPTEFVIGNAYPNPFNPVVSFDYAVPVSTDMAIKVYDISGRVVSTLIDNVVEPGFYSLTWNADQNSSGVYFVRFNVGGDMTTKKVMLVK
jgi:hypothetical protein